MTPQPTWQPASTPPPADTHTPATIGPAVRWIDDAGGHHTGRVVQCTLRMKSVDDFIRAEKLVLEDCDGVLTWVKQDALQPWPSRQERGEE